MLGTSARPILSSGPALFTPKLPKVAPHSAESGRGRGLESTRRRCTERWELVWLAGACAVGMRCSELSRTLAIADCRAAQQGSRRPGVEVRMKKMNRALRRALRAPGPGRNVGSCPTAKFARGPEIRAMRGACRYRGKGHARGAPWLAGGSRTYARAWQSCSPGPRGKTRTCARCPIDRLSAPRAPSCRSILRTGHGWDDHEAK